MVPRADEMVCTPSGTIDLAPEYIVGDLPRLRDAHRRDADDGSVLVSRRHLRSKNSWMHNVKVLVKGKDRCTLLVHPDDAARRRPRRRRAGPGSRRRPASLEVPVEVSDEMMPGVVSLPHGWGHDRPGTRLSVAREHAGVNNNLLAPGALRRRAVGQRRGQRHPRRGRPGLRSYRVRLLRSASGGTTMLRNLRARSVDRRGPS